MFRSSKMDIRKLYTSFEITIRGTFDDPLFRARDVANVLEIANIRQNIADFDDTEKTQCVEETSGGKQYVVYLTEKGLYKLIFRSRKDFAIQFQNWVIGVVKEIRINGAYELRKENENNKQTIEAMKKQIEQLECDQKGPFMYIFDMDTRTEITKKKQLKIGLTEQNPRQRAKPYRQTCKFGEIVFSMEVPTHANLKQFEKWIHALLKPYRIAGDGEVFELDLELAKLWMLYALHMVQIADCKDENEKRIHLAKIVDAHNMIRGIESGSALKREIGTQTDDIPMAEVIRSESQQVDELGTFDMFIESECVIGSDLEVSSVDIEGKYRLWARSATKEAFHKLLEYLKTRFRPVRLSVQDKDGVINGFRGVTIKRNEVTLGLAPTDPELFLWHMCDYKPCNKTLLSDLYQEYQRWAERIGKKVNDSDLRAYLGECPHVLISNVWTHNGNGRGVYGVCLKNDVSLIKQRKPSTTSKMVQKRDGDGNVVDQWTTIAKAAQSEGVAAARMSRIVKDRTLVNGFFYTTQESS